MNKFGFTASGLSQAVFCRRKQVHPTTLSMWLEERKKARRREGKKEANSCAFKEVEVEATECVGGERELGGGTRTCDTCKLPGTPIESTPH